MSAPAVLRLPLVVAGRMVLAAGIMLCAGVVLLAGAEPSKPGVEDRFAVQLEYLRWQPRDEIGRDALVAAYERFIAQFEKDPRVAEAMMDVAHLMKGEFPRQGLKPDHEAAFVWCRKAAARAVPGTPFWRKANFSLAGWMSLKDTAEARRILQTIVEDAHGHSLTLARVERDLQVVCLREHDLAAAEVHCRRVLEWYNDPARVPKEDMEKYDLDGVMAEAGSIMIGAYLTAPWPKAERKRRIEALARSDFTDFELKMEVDRALEDLKTRHEVPETVVFDKVADSRAGWRWALSIAGLVLLVVMGYFVYRRPWRRVA